MDCFLKVLSINLILLAIHVTSGVVAIHCWDCNSKYDSRCLDHFNNYSTALVDCDQMPDKVQHIDINDDLGEVSRATLCRKTVQTVEGEIRIIRGCGWVKNFGELENRTCFNRAGTNQVQIYHCVCTHDACNGAQNLDSITWRTLGTLLMALVGPTLLPAILVA